MNLEQVSQANIKHLDFNMRCKYISQCGGCSYDSSYLEQLNDKINISKEFLKEFNIKNFDIFSTKEYHFRNRAEFRIFHQKDDIFYALHSKDKKLMIIKECLIVNEMIYNLMPRLLDEI
jgi:tRNA (uracil-5-)-methyltransferase